jgi:type VI secretion system protein
MRVQLAEDANARTPVPVDLVFVWDKAVAGQLVSTAARDWFASKKFEFRQDDPEGRKLTICEWEWVPGQNVADINLAVPAAARRWSHGVFVFADYRSPGAHRARLMPGSEAILELGRDDLNLRSVGKASSPEFEWLDRTCQPPESAAGSTK